MKKQCEANLGTWKQLAEERKQQKEAEQAAKEKAEQEKAGVDENEAEDATDDESSPENEVDYTWYSLTAIEDNASKFNENFSTITDYKHL